MNRLIKLLSLGLLASCVACGSQQKVGGAVEGDQLQVIGSAGNVIVNSQYPVAGKQTAEVDAKLLCAAMGGTRYVVRNKASGVAVFERSCK